MFRKVMMTTALLSLSLFAQTGALWASPTETRSVQVHSSDLDLASENGRVMLRQRIDNAVHGVCSETGWGSSLAAQKIIEACNAKALTTAMVQLDA